MNDGKKILKLPLRISLAIVLFGILAKLLEWSYAKEIMLVGFITLTALYAIRFANKKQKHFLDSTKLVLVLAWSINGVLQVLDLPYTLISQIITAVAFVTWFVMEGTAYFLDDDRKAQNSIGQILWNGILIIGSLVVISGAIMQVLEWDYAIHMLSLGITLIGAYILKDVFVPSEHRDEEQNNTGLQY